MRSILAEPSHTLVLYSRRGKNRIAIQQLLPASQRQCMSKSAKRVRRHQDKPREVAVDLRDILDSRPPRFVSPMPRRHKNRVIFGYPIWGIVPFATALQAAVVEPEHVPVIAARRVEAVDVRALDVSSTFGEVDELFFNDDVPVSITFEDQCTGDAFFAILWERSVLRNE
jgi:hypothetical protein